MKIEVPPAHQNRLTQRERYFFDPLVSLCGGSLEGRRVLDLGCHVGRWSLSAINAGAEFVHGVDGRETHIEQARIVFSEYGVNPSRYRFDTGNVFELGDLEPFNVVLCLGLLYHVAKPFELIERISGWNTDLAVIDSSVNRYPGAILELHHEDTEVLWNAVDYEVVVSPSKGALAEIAAQFGYRTVVLKPRFSDWTGCRDYRNGTRRALICAKHTPLVGVDTEEDRPIRDAAAWLGRVMGRTFIKPSARRVRSFSLGPLPAPAVGLRDSREPRSTSGRANRFRLPNN